MTRRHLVMTLMNAVSAAAGLMTLCLSCWLVTHPFPYRLGVEQDSLLRSLNNALLITFAAAVVLGILGMTLRGSRGAWSWAQWIGTGSAVGGLFLLAFGNSGVHSAPSEPNRCINAMLRINGLKERYSVEHKLGNGIVLTLRKLSSAGEAIPQCPGGGIYTIGAAGGKPLCSVHGVCE